jgi:pyruvate kinase
MSKKFSTKCTKILATVGAVDGNGSRQGLEKIIRAGANGLRINFSHAKYDEVKQQIEWIREVACEVGRNVSILADLQGPKIRIGDLKDNMRLAIKGGDTIKLVYGAKHRGGLTLPSQYNLSSKVKKGERVFLFDGKIETETASELKNLAEITKLSDGVMAARGDLAYEVGAELVPVIQTRLVKICKRLKKFSIVATQMMSSMVDNESPTRAEVSDVARAVFDGANYVMLSEETALGKYPVETVTEMSRIIKTVSKNLR